MDKAARIAESPHLGLQTLWGRSTSTFGRPACGQREWVLWHPGRHWGVLGGAAGTSQPPLPYFHPPPQPRLSSANQSRHLLWQVFPFTFSLLSAPSQGSALEPDSLISLLMLRFCSHRSHLPSLPCPPSVRRRGLRGPWGGAGAAGVWGEEGRWRWIVAPGYPAIPQHLPASSSGGLPPPFWRQMLGRETLLVFPSPSFSHKLAQLPGISHLLRGNHLGDWGA